MQSKDDEPRADDAHLVEVTRVQPFEADVIAARLRASGIEATVGADSPYESVSFAEGIAVLVSAADEQRARAVLENGDHDG